MEDPLSNRYAGIYYDPKDPDNLFAFARKQLFLAAAARVVPVFAESLFQVVWSILNERIGRCGSVPRNGAPDYAQFYVGLFAAIRGWSKQFKIDANWVVNEGLSAALCALRYVEKGIDPVAALGTWRRSPSASLEKHSFELSAWDPKLESEADYRRRVDEEWPKFRDEYIASQISKVEHAGLQRIQRRRHRRHTTDEKFEWAALHRCTGSSFEQIASEEDEETQYVRSTVLEVLAGLGFGEAAES
jgi:hypothetical protein